MTKLSKVPSALPMPDGTNSLNMAAVIRWLWEMDHEDLAEMGNLEVRAKLIAWKERVAAVQRACIVMACPPSLDDLLWEHGNGDELERRLKALPREPGTIKVRTDFDLFDVILTERG